MAWLAYYKMDSTTDYVGTRTLSVAAGTPSIVPGLEGNCYSYSSAAHGISDNFGENYNSAFTHSCWVMINSTASSQTYISNYVEDGTNDIVHYIQHQAGATSMYFGDSTQGGGTSDLNITITLSTGVWYHFVNSGDGGASGSRKRRVWINGVSVGSLDNATIDYGGGTSGDANRIGCYDNSVGKSNYLDGKVDEYGVENAFTDSNAKVKNIYSYFRGFF